MARSRNSSNPDVTVKFQPTEHRLSDSWWPKLLTATPIRASTLRSISGYFNSVFEDRAIFEEVYRGKYEHTVELPLRLYESFRLIFNAIQRYGVRMGRELDIRDFRITKTALLHQAVQYRQISDLEHRLRYRLETMTPRGRDIPTLLASVPNDDGSVNLLINNLARLYDHHRRHKDVHGMRGIYGLVDESRNLHFVQRFADEIRRRQTRDCECKKDWCCGRHECCVHIQRPDLHVADDGDDEDDEYGTAREHRSRGFERSRPVQDNDHDHVHAEQGAGFYFNPRHHRHCVDFAFEQQCPDVVEAASSRQDGHSSRTTTRTTSTSSDSATAARIHRRRSSVPTSQASTFIPGRVASGVLEDDSIRRRHSHARTSTATSTSTTSSSSTSSSCSSYNRLNELEKHARAYTGIFRNEAGPPPSPPSRGGRRDRQDGGRDAGWAWSWCMGSSRRGERDGGRDTRGRTKGCRSKSIDIDDIRGGLCCIFF